MTMIDRKLILRVLLWALGIAAVTGASAIVLGTSDIVGRVAGTSLAVAVACACLLPLSGMLDRAEQRPVGLLGMTIVVVEFCLAVALIWKIYEFVGSYGDVWWALVGTMGAVAICGAAGMGFLKLAGKSSTRLAGKVGLVLAAATLILWNVSNWIWAWHSALNSGAWWWAQSFGATGAALGGLGIPAVAALVGVGAKPARHWRWVGVIAAAAAFVMAAIGIWAELHRGSENLITVISIAVVVAHANLALLVPLKPGQRWLLVVAIGAAIVTAVMVDLYGYLPHDFSFDRLAGAAAIIAGCATLALLVLARINRGVDVEAMPHEFQDVSLTCPRCQKKQKLPLGEAACSACGLRIAIRVEEPRCPKCGYLLYMLTGPNCPECGTAIAAPATPTTGLV